MRKNKVTEAFVKFNDWLAGELPPAEAKAVAEQLARRDSPINKALGELENAMNEILGEGRAADESRVPPSKPFTSRHGRGRGGTGGPPLP